MKVSIVIKPKEQFRQVNAVGIHRLEPSFNELLDAIETAEKDNFEVIYIYTSKSFWTMSNVKASNSTWNKLRKVYDDVRAGMISTPYTYKYLGDGFTIYL